jgi:hypothetical protein
VTRALAYNVGQFTNSDRHCPDPNCGKRLIVEDGAHRCPSCSYYEASSALIQPMSVREAVATVAASRGVEHTTTPCPGCFVLVIETETFRGKSMPVDAAQVGGGRFTLVARQGLRPLSSGLKLSAWSATTPGYRAHQCGREET